MIYKGIARIVQSERGSLFVKVRVLTRLSCHFRNLFRLFTQKGLQKGGGGGVKAGGGVLNKV